MYLDGIMKKVASEAGWDTTQLRTRLSLRATAASSLMEKQIPEVSVEKVTRHRSSSALQEYVRSDSVQKATSNALASPLVHLNKTMKNDELNEENKGILIQCSSKDYSYLQGNCLKKNAYKNNSTKKIINQDKALKKSQKRVSEKLYAKDDFDDDSDLERQLVLFGEQKEHKEIAIEKTYEQIS